MVNFLHVLFGFFGNNTVGSIDVLFLI